MTKKYKGSEIVIRKIEDWMIIIGVSVSFMSAIYYYYKDNFDEATFFICLAIFCVVSAIFCNND